MAQTDNLVPVSPTVRFMLALNKIDQLQLSPRDVTIIWAIQQNPGSMGAEIAEKLGLPSKSNVRFNLQRLTRLGYIEDRRARKLGAIPNILHTTPAGDHFLEVIVP